jgi:hypothetical protein
VAKPTPTPAAASSTQKEIAEAPQSSTPELTDMASLFSCALVGSLALHAGERAAIAPLPGALKRLRGGELPPLPNAAQAQNALAYITIGQALVGHAYTKESTDLYEFKDEVTGPSLAFAQMNYAMQIAHGVMLFSPNHAIPALAIAIFSSTHVTRDLKSPRTPMVAWAAALWLLQKYTDCCAVPSWVVPALCARSAAVMPHLSLPRRSDDDPLSHNPPPLHAG